MVVALGKVSDAISVFDVASNVVDVCSCDLVSTVGGTTVVDELCAISVTGSAFIEIDGGTSVDMIDWDLWIKLYIQSCSHI